MIGLFVKISVCAPTTPMHARILRLQMQRSADGFRCLCLSQSPSSSRRCRRIQSTDRARTVLVLFVKSSVCAPTTPSHVRILRLRVQLYKPTAGPAWLRCTSRLPSDNYARPACAVIAPRPARQFNSPSARHERASSPAFSGCRALVAST